ncbi:MAG TPA: hypothetical protein ENI95_14525 [Chloroflexi bacterium]|nr:hypothetical protein [Chloroflexota bacterium]
MRAFAWLLSVLYCQTMNEKSHWRTRWLELAHTWEERLSEAGLLGVARPLSEALRPLAPLLAQFLWIAQPAFGLFGQAGAVGALAELLEEPDQLNNPSGADFGHTQQSQDR